MFHAECGGIVIGELGKEFRCAECEAEMTAFVFMMKKVQNGADNGFSEVPA
jgi:hypothetical protein